MPLSIILQVYFASYYAVKCQLQLTYHFIDDFWIHYHFVILFSYRNVNYYICYAT